MFSPTDSEGRSNNSVKLPEQIYTIQDSLHSPNWANSVHVLFVLHWIIILHQFSYSYMLIIFDSSHDRTQKETP